MPQPEPEPEPEATGAEPSWSLRGRHRVLSDAAASAPPQRPCPPCDGRERRGQPLAGRWAAGAMAAPEPLRPRLCRLVRGEHGYGFHLHGEKGRRGQFIRRVEPGSPAEAAALRAGDRLVEVNGVNVEGETHHQVGVCAPPPARRPADPPRTPTPQPQRASLPRAPVTTGLGAACAQASVPSPRQEGIAQGPLWAPVERRGTWPPRPRRPASFRASSTRVGPAPRGVDPGKGGARTAAPAGLSPGSSLLVLFRRRAVCGGAGTSGVSVSLGPRCFSPSVYICACVNVCERRALECTCRGFHSEGTPVCGRIS